MKKILVFCLATTFTFTTKVSNAQTEVTFYTNMGNFVAEMYDTLQPITAGNFVSLVNAKFYDGVIFHRVISNFMIQGGDPTGTGSGGPGYTIADEFNPLASNVQKTLAMANSGPNTGGSQFFINLVNNTYLDPKHPVFGIVTADFSVVQAIGAVQTNSSDRPLTDVVMDSVRVTNSPVGINHGKYEGLNIDIFPNPTEDYINIDLGKNFPTIKNSTLNIINLLGQVVYTTPIQQQKTKVKLNSKGVYFVHLTDEQGKIITIKKITLQ